MGAYGDGGLVTSNDDELADNIRIRRVHGSKAKCCHHLVRACQEVLSIQIFPELRVKEREYVVEQIY